ncbi:pyrroline-5-carboxylate reductase [Candidatus Peregrinibacteria bacterium]|nr:pyrroline-5-carboxylate reductase [Candidatus Peregrinibacteria bacterium]
MNILIIGSGNMGSAIAHGMIKHFETGCDLIISDTNPEKLEQYRNLEVTVTTTLSKECLSTCDTIILATKPQSFPALLQELKSLIREPKLILSIAAGITIDTLRIHLGQEKIVRIMPNTPALIGAGISAWYATPSVSNEEKERVKNILKALGEEIETQNEDEIDIATALSGSGPAYSFYFLEKLIDGAVSLGMKKNIAKRLAISTVMGSCKLAQVSQEDFSSLRQKVTSKGGTTEAAMSVFEKKSFGDIVKKAIKMAYKRAKELAQ